MNSFEPTHFITVHNYLIDQFIYYYITVNV